MADTRRPDGLRPLPVAPDADSETTEVFWKTPATFDRVENDTTELRDVRPSPGGTPTQVLDRRPRSAELPTEEVAPPLAPSSLPPLRPAPRTRWGPIVGLVVVSIVGFVLGAVLVLLVALG